MSNCCGERVKMKISDTIKCAILQNPERKKQILEQNGFFVKAFGWITYTFRDGSTFKEQL